MAEFKKGQLVKLVDASGDIPGEDPHGRFYGHLSTVAWIIADEETEGGIIHLYPVEKVTGWSGAIYHKEAKIGWFSWRVAPLETEDYEHYGVTAVQII